MSIYSNINEHDLIKVRKLAEQQDSQRALEKKQNFKANTRLKNSRKSFTYH